jgi:carboxymethylenebutenolidase
MSSGLLLLHAWWGLNDDVRARAEKLRAEGYTVATPDLFAGRTAKTREEARALSSSFEKDEGDLTRRVDEALRGLGGMVDRLAIVSWSFGNYYAWKVGVAHPDAVRAIVCFYGLAVADTSKRMPPTLSHYAELDEFEDLESTRKAEKELRAAGTDIRLELYPGTKHWFDETSRPEYDEAASTLAWERTRSFLKEHLGSR